MRSALLRKRLPGVVIVRLRLVCLRSVHNVHSDSDTMRAPIHDSTVRSALRGYSTSHPPILAVANLLVIVGVEASASKIPLTEANIFLIVS